ncbi:MAG: hypothetical protein KF723_22140 [Rhizobiaceae bacterium]|nr:hypothetical protein [Rhizobiaceae bacterium]
MIRVVTFHWWDPGYRWNKHFIYGVEHVNRLFRGVNRNTTIPFEFVVVTDQVDGAFDEGIRVVPLWNDLRDMGGCFVRLRAFHEDMAGIIGERFVWFDLDSVVTGNLDPLLSREDDFVAWENIYPPVLYCGSMIMMKAGARAKVWHEFDREKSPAIGRDLKYVGTDQAWISACLGSGEATWGEEDGVLSYRQHCCGGPNLPAGARIVFFHGALDPSMPSLQEKSPWIRDHWV